MRIKPENVTYKFYVVYTNSIPQDPEITDRLRQGDLAAWHKKVCVAKWGGFSGRSEKDGQTAATLNEAFTPPFTVKEELEQRAYVRLCESVASQFVEEPGHARPQQVQSG